MGAHVFNPTEQDERDYLEIVKQKLNDEIGDTDRRVGEIGRASCRERV